ncbi:hypothetical protein GN956_G19980 [Arapaima gigas]
MGLSLENSKCAAFFPQISGRRSLKAWKTVPCFSWASGQREENKSSLALKYGLCQRTGVQVVINGTQDGGSRTKQARWKDPEASQATLKCQHFTPVSADISPHSGIFFGHNGASWELEADEPGEEGDNP